MTKARRGRVPSRAEQPASAAQANPSAGPFGAIPAAVALVVIASGGGAWADPFVLRIDGAQGVRYEGTCTVTSETHETRTIELAGTVPSSRTLPVRSLDCEVRTSGPIEFTLLHGNGVTRSATSGGTVHFAVRR